MSSEGDPITWKVVGGTVLAFLSVPLGFLWKKAVGAASKEELASAIREAKDERKEIKGMVKTQFENAERDRRRFSDAVSKVSSDVHDARMDFMDRLATHGKEVNARLDIISDKLTNHLTRDK